MLERFKVVPLLVGDATAAEVAQVIDLLWGGTETRFIIGSDLSHYLDSDGARRLDRATAEAIEKLAAERVGEDQACGRVPICGMLKAASTHGLQPRTVDLRNSGDTAGDKSRVVGYGAYVFHA